MLALSVDFGASKMCLAWFLLWRCWLSTLLQKSRLAALLSWLGLQVHPAKSEELALLNPGVLVGSFVAESGFPLLASSSECQTIDSFTSQKNTSQTLLSLHSSNARHHGHETRQNASDDHEILQEHLTR